MIFGQKLDFLEFFKVCGILNFLAEEIVVLLVVVVVVVLCCIRGSWNTLYLNRI